MYAAQLIIDAAVKPLNEGDAENEANEAEGEEEGNANEEADVGSARDHGDGDAARSALQDYVHGRQQQVAVEHEDLRSRVRRFCLSLVSVVDDEQSANEDGISAATTTTVAAEVEKTLTCDAQASSVSSACVALSESAARVAATNDIYRQAVACVAGELISVVQASDATQVR